jgi:hypothetical protein
MTRTLTAIALATMSSIAPGTGSAQAAEQAPGTFEWHTWTGDAGSRRYKLFVPAGYDRARPAPRPRGRRRCW